MGLASNAAVKASWEAKKTFRARGAEGRPQLRYVRSMRLVWNA
jgi:hypothetical protein